MQVSTCHSGSRAAIQFARGRAREFRKDRNRTRTLERRQPATYFVLEVARVERVPVTEDNSSGHLFTANRIGCTKYASSLDCGQRFQNAFDFGWRYVFAARDNAFR